MRFLIVSENFTGLQPWLHHDEAPRGMPAVYHLFKYLGQSDQHSFKAIIFSKEVSRVIDFPNGSTIRLYKLWCPIHYLWKFISFFKAYQVIVQLFREEHFDLIYTMSFYNLLGTLIRKRFRIFTVSRKYGNQMLAAVEQRNYWKLYTRYIFETLAFKYPAHLTIVTKDGTRSAEIAGFFNRKNQVYSLFNGMDVQMKQALLALPILETFPHSSCLKMVCIARLERKKRLDLAIGIVEQLVHKFTISNVQLDIIGEGSQKRRLNALIEKKKLANHINILSAVPHHQIPNTIARYDICLFCYDKGVMGNILWECMLGGKLILVRASGDTSIFNLDNAIKIEDSPHFEGEAATKIASIMGRNVSQICQNARSLASKLIVDWETRFEEELNLIQKKIKSMDNH